MTALRPPIRLNVRRKDHADAIEKYLIERDVPFERDRFDAGDDSRFYVNREHAFTLREAADEARLAKAESGEENAR